MARGNSHSHHGIDRRTFLAGGVVLGGGLAGLNLSRARLASAQTPKRGGTLIAAAEIDPIGLDPHNSSNFSSAQAYDHIYESLTSYDEKTNIVPCLATSWEVTNGGKTYTFKLRPNVKFHNGQTMTADDVKYSIERVLDPKTASPWISWLKAIKEIKVIDPLTVQMNLEAPYPLLGSFAGIRASGIIPKGYAEQENLKIKGIGTGPFKLVEYVPQDRIVYARNPDYWDKSLPYLDGMVFKVLTEENARIAALRAGQIQYAFLSGQGAAQLEGAPGITVNKSPTAWVVDPLHQQAEQVPHRRARPARSQDGRRHERGDPEGRVRRRRALGPRAHGLRRLVHRPEDPALREGGRRGRQEAPGRGRVPERRLQDRDQVLAPVPGVRRHDAGDPGVAQEAQRRRHRDPDGVGRVRGRQQEVERQLRSRKARTSTRPPTRSAPTRTATSTPTSTRRGRSTRAAATRRTRSSTPCWSRRASPATTRSGSGSTRRSSASAMRDSLDWWWYAKYNIEAVSNKLQGYSQSFTGRRLFLKKASLA